MFRVGQKVVCVDAGPTDAGLPSILTKDAVYTIASIKEFWGGLGVRLIEITLPDYAPRHVNAWKAERFRPVVERKTDISVFTQLLKPTKVAEPVR